jgi:outer membrane protein assembly factor BamB
MKKSLFLLAAWLMTVSNMYAQRQADWTADLPSSGSQIFFHSLTGVPIIKGDDYYAGIDVQTHAVKWTIKRSGLQAVAAALGNDEGEDFFEVAYSPFAVVNHTVVDTRDGKIILNGEKDGYKKVIDYEIMPDIEGILFRTSSDGFVRLHLVDKKTGDKKWSSNILKASNSLGAMFGASAANAIPQVEVPIGTSALLQDNKLMVFQYKKEIALINVADGKPMWTQKLDPARILFSADQKTAYFIEHDKGGLIAQALAAGTKRMGKEITAIDVTSGKEVWKKPLEAEERIKWYDLDGDKLLIVHAKGCNFYSMTDGKAIWKSDFDAKRISKIDENTEGYLIYYGYQKSMQIDKVGKKVWKKAQVVPAEFEDADDIDEDVDYITYKYDKGQLFLYPTKLRFYPTKASGLKKFSITIAADTKLEYDEARKTMLVYDDDGITLVQPDKFPKGFLLKKTKTKVKDIQFVELRENSYYFAGQEDFVIVKPEGEVNERHYKEPFDGKGFLSGALNVALSVAGAAYQVSGTTKMMRGAADMTGSAVTGSESLSKSGEKDVKKGVKEHNTGVMMSEAASFMPPSRHSAFSQTRDFAYFFTKDKKSGEKVLIKVNKDTGEEMDKLILNDARPIYKVDEVEDRVLYSFKKQILAFEPKK